MFFYKKFLFFLNKKPYLLLKEGFLLLFQFVLSSFFLNYILYKINKNAIPTYIKANKDNPTIPVISPAFPNLLPIFLADFTPNIIASIPVGKTKYQKNCRDCLFGIKCC